MSSTTKEPASAPSTFKVTNKKEQELKPQRRRGRQEPNTDPTGGSLPSRDLNSLSEEQLRKLTKANTRKNHGGRSSRLRSQVERVFRRLDNLVADAKLQPRYSIDALPVVCPDDPSVMIENHCTRAKESEVPDVTSNSDQQETVANPDYQEDSINYAEAESPETTSSHGAKQKLDAMALDNEDFEIEPATNNSAFMACPTSTGVESGSLRSVRISTAVTILDYNPSQPVTIKQQLERYEHPTRTGKCLQARRYLSEEITSFPRAMQRLDEIREEDQVSARDIQRRNTEWANMGPRLHRSSPPPPRRVHSAGSSPTSFIVPALSGPYGSRTKLPEGPPA